MPESSSTDLSQPRNDSSVDEADVVQNSVADYSLVTKALGKEGLTPITLIFGIDFTLANIWKGKDSFGYKSLHYIGWTPTPYEKVMSIIGKTLAPLSEDNMFQCYGFGDVTTRDGNVFSFHSDHLPCRGIEEVLSCYRNMVQHLQFSWPISFAPVVKAAINTAEKNSDRYHILVIITNGQFSRSGYTSDELSPQEMQTIQSIVDASSYPLSIVLVGVGDGPWEDMQKFVEKIPARKFDNFQFVNFTEMMPADGIHADNEIAFLTAALMGIPEQHNAAIGLDILRAKRIAPLPPPARHTPHRVPAVGPRVHGVPAVGPRDPYEASIEALLAEIRVPAVGPRDSPEAKIEALLAEIRVLAVGPRDSPEAKIKALLAEMEDKICRICRVNVKDLALGCGHEVCTVCQPEMETCPFCREKIEIGKCIKLFR